MRIIHLPNPKPNYCCKTYLILGEWGGLSDVNTIVDPGPDDSIIDAIENTYTGVGKIPVDVIVLTHNHFDHAAAASAVKKRYDARVYAYAPDPCVDQKLHGGESIKFGDEVFEVIHAPFHSVDSVCLYCKAKGVLFTGDVNIRVMRPDQQYSQEYKDFLRSLSKLHLEVVYSGHDLPLTENIHSLLSESLRVLG